MATGSLSCGERAPLSRSPYPAGGVIKDLSGLAALRWPRFSGPDDDAALYLASLIRTEIGLGDWPANERIPDRALLAEAIGVCVNVADMAIDQLVRSGWITPHPTGAHLACEPPSRRIRAGGFYEAVHGRAWPDAIEFAEPSPDPALVAPLPAPAHSERALNVPRQKIRDRKQGTHSTYLVGIDGLPLVKIGRTTWNPKARLKSLQTGQPMDLYLLWSVPGDYERELHVRFARYRIRGEWFDLSSLGDPIEVVTAAVAAIEGASRL